MNGEYKQHQSIYLLGEFFFFFLVFFLEFVPCTLLSRSCDLLGPTHWEGAISACRDRHADSYKEKLDFDAV